MKNQILIVSLLISFVFLFGCNGMTEIVDKAVDTKNPAVCNELESENKIDDCFGQVAEELNDPSLCTQARDPNDCIARYSMSKSSIKYCDLCSDEAAKYTCIARVTGDQTGRALDAIIKDWRGSGTIEKCKEQCTSEYEFCKNSYYNAMKAAQDNCLSSYTPASDYYYNCLDSAQKARESGALRCYEEELDCKARCEKS